MQFPTLEFAVFFAITLSVSWLVRRQRTYQKLFLLAASYYFYAKLGLLPLGLILLSSLVFFAAGEGILRCSSRGARRAWLLLAVVANLGLLGFFKYYNFFQENLADLADFLGLGAHLPLIEVLFPVGISFYVFQGLSYILDVYWGRYKPPKAEGLPQLADAALNFLLYMAFFPQLLAGPICRGRELLPQFMGQAPRHVPQLSRAATLILSGLFKKVVLAHFIDTHLVSAVFNTPENYTAAALWMGMAGYTMLIYWDFSGYTDLARGLGLLLGFHIPENFDHPYIATDISDFWRRWHITLSFWLRDYIFLPLAGRWSAGLRAHLGRQASALWGSQLALLVTFLACGLWHGAAWTFVLWGAYHGVLLFCHHGLRSGMKLRWQGGWWGRAGTLLLVAFGWVIFNAADLATVKLYLGRLFAFSAEGMGFELLAVPAIVLGLALQVWGPRLRMWYITTSEQLPWLARLMLWFITGLLILALKPSGIAPYIYFTF